MNLTTDNIDNTLLVLHGHFATIESHNLGLAFYDRMVECDVVFEDFSNAYKAVADFISQGYYDNKEENDVSYINDVVSKMVEVIKIAKMIEGYKDMAELNKALAEESMESESNDAYKDGGILNV